MKQSSSQKKLLSEETTTSSVGNVSEPTRNLGKASFKCSNDQFDKCLIGRQKNKHWKKFLGDNNMASTIKAYFKSSKEQSVLLQRGEFKHFLNVSRKGW